MVCVPTMEANQSGLKATRQMVNMISDQNRVDSPDIQTEVDVIEAEVHAVMREVLRLGQGDIARGAVAAFQDGIIDVPFAPAKANLGKLTPVRDNYGAIRLFDRGNTPLPSDVIAFHHDKIAERARAESREPSFSMVVDDVRAISACKLVGRPA